MSWVNRANETTGACQCFFHEALDAAIAGHDHGEALRKLDMALHELRTVEDQARFLANLFGCEVKDVWEVIHFAARHQENSISDYTKWMKTVAEKSNTREP
jgi:hypothetical protein